MYFYRFELYDGIQAMVNRILTFKENDGRKRDLTTALRWRDNLTTYASVLEDIEQVVIEDIKRDIKDQEQVTAAEVNSSLDLFLFHRINYMYLFNCHKLTSVFNSFLPFS